MCANGVYWYRVASLLSVVKTAAYLSKATRMMSETERAAVVDMIAAAPRAGVLVPGTGGLRKLRIPLQGRGKRGGGRVIYWFHSEGYPAVLLWPSRRTKRPTSRRNSGDD